ncbi:SIR2 family NAD-dependent protein deacylase [Faunimonas sp. B44]|uniref:SIR2 family NAD-dependent protein deacylase n=1 Tax=Faunimonas sp. B44 TaxID=3461493 RepID=UPI004043F21E
MPDDLAELVDAVRERRAILFAGAGVSMSVGLPSWQTLIEHLAAELDMDPAEAIATAGSHQALAEYYRLRQGSIGPLRSWMDREWKVSEARVRASRLHQLLVELDFPIIYTTNYDRNLETAYELAGRPYVKVANARDVAKATWDVTQIVKFHGDFEDDSSLVLAETDYFSRLSFDSPLDVKFRADAMGHPVLFIGYSMQDLNIRLLLHRLWETWARSGYERDRPKSFVFMPRANPVQQAVLGRWGITVVTGESDDPEEALCVFLQELDLRAKERPSRPEPRAALPVT